MDPAQMPDVKKDVLFEKRGCVAIITLNRESKLNALTQPHYFYIATLLHEIAAMDDITITVLTAKGRFFSAGADVTASRPTTDDTASARKLYTSSFVTNNFHNTHAFYTHPKILITALNGPAVGLSAALIAHSDFIYAAPHAYLLTPFTSLGLVAEGGASVAFVRRLGQSKANEALLTSRRIMCPELVQTGFVNKVFLDGGGDETSGKGIQSGKFLDAVLAEVDDRFGAREGGHLNHESVLGVKRLIRAPGLRDLDVAGSEEVWGGLRMFMRGLPQEEFRRLASGEKRHKL
ncbi:MAG: hypothetical protein M1828_006093 [Chrysothrix sp. TS-e1954]|nr:MAG: hypothetical protein M1828_006093 [Chrysothrix sp. TS-e1954]